METSQSELQIEPPKWTMAEVKQLHSFVATLDDRLQHRMTSPVQIEVCRRDGNLASDQLTQ
jgi:hypothetical protein